MIRFFVLCLAVLFVESQGQCQFTKNLNPTDEVEVFSPGYPNNYPAGSKCSWTLTAPVGYSVAIYCPDFQLPVTTNCRSDSFTLNEKVYCSNGTVYAVTKNNNLNIAFKSSTNRGKFYCTASVQPNSCTCGRRKGTKIVGGTDARLHEFPYQSYMAGPDGKVLCSANIISPDYLLTAAHCLTGQDPTKIKVVVGDHDISTPTETNTTASYAVREFIINKDYNSTTSLNDIGLIRLKTPIVFNDDVGPICLPFSLTTTPLESKTVTLAGWGTLGFGEPLPKILQKVDVQTTTQARCKADNPTADNSIICTFAVDKDSCQLDSGGSVYYEQNGRVYTIGVISGGSGCASSKAAMNTRVTTQLNWIMANTVSTNFCTA